MITVVWKGARVFEGVNDEGIKWTMDAPEEFGGIAAGPSPLDVLLAALGGCAGIDVVSILMKKRLSISRYRIEIHGTRKEGEYPHPFTSIVLRHIVEGPDITEEVVAHTVALSDEKYCSAIATLRFSPVVRSEYQVVTTEPETAS